MTEFGHMMVDWEQRIDIDRMRRERLAKAKEAVANSDVEALIITRMEDVRYLTGIRSHLGPTVNLGLAAALLPRGGDPIIYTMDLDVVKATMPWLPVEKLEPRNNIREYPGARAWAQRLREALGTPGNGKIGIDIINAPLLKALTEAFPNAEFVDGWEVLMRAKMVKTEDEIECIKAANIITEAGMDAALRFLKPGVRECEVLAVAWQVMTALGSEWTQCSNIVASGPYTAPYRRFTSDRIIRLGDPVIIDIGGCFNGYWGDFTRTYICGDIRPTREQIHWHQECYNAVFAACAAAKPGNTSHDTFRAAMPYAKGSCGHAAGTSPWETPFLSLDSAEVVLRPGFVFSIEPYAGQPGIGGFRLENNVIVREDGPEIYSTYPFDERLLKDVHPLDVSTGRTVPKWLSTA